MLKEIPREIVIEKKGEPNCRWFRDDYFDLFIWFNDDNEFLRFQLYYDIFKDHKALFWNNKLGFSHHVVDEGEIKPCKPKPVPIVLLNGDIQTDIVISEFENRCLQIDETVSNFIKTNLNELERMK